jgi:hypothetical protein
MKSSTSEARISKAFVTLAIMGLGTTVSAQVDGFNKGKGNMDLVGSLSYGQGLAYYLAEGTAPITRAGVAFSLFAARGITEDLDVQLNVPFISINGSSGLQDGQLFLKWLPLKTSMASGTFSFGAAIGGSTPLSDYETEGIGAIGQQASSFIPMGVAHYMAGSGLFISLVGGQIAASSPTPDALIGTFRVGKASSDSYWEAYVQAQEAHGGKDYLGVGDLAPSTFKELGVSFIKVGGKYYKPFGERFGWVVEASYALAGRNVDQSLMAAGSFIMHFRK